MLGHTNTSVADGQGVVGLVWDDLDLEVGLGLQLLWLDDSLVSDLVEGIRGVGNELSEENLLVGVESVDNCSILEKNKGVFHVSASAIRFIRYSGSIRPVVVSTFH